MTLGLVPSDAGLLCLQAGVVAMPRALPPAALVELRRFRGRGWALVPVGSIVLVILAIRYASATADWLTWLALIAVPLLSVAALGWLMHGARRWWALAVPALFLLAWRLPGALVGEGAAALLSGLSCVSLGVLLGAVTPPRWLKLGILAMAGADVWLIATQTLQVPNNVLVAAAPGGGLPQLQSELFGSVSLGYGDLFVAGLLGALWSGRPSGQWRLALVTLALAAVFDVVFDLAHNELPATVPVALALLVGEAWRAWQVSRDGRGDRMAPRLSSVDRCA
ncbi:MAG TPA: hypothetical protein VFN48_11500 [Solirubrobacteraceae bacterium]|nr:hypothetical protein [Solirubrobacteraceae bacterium]